MSSVNLTTSSQTANVTFTVVATDNVGINGLSVSGATLVSNSGNTWGFTKTYNYSDYSFGSSSDTVTATATDSVVVQPILLLLVLAREIMKILILVILKVLIVLLLIIPESNTYFSTCY